MSSTQALDPCPFCGGTASIQHEHDLYLDRYQHHFVKCRSCGACGAAKLANEDDAHGAIQAVIAAWNRRAALPTEAPEPVKGELPTIPIELGYTNYRGEWAMRKIVPVRLWWGATEWHPEPQWLLHAWDVEKRANRDFALKDFGDRAAIIEECAKVAQGWETNSAGDDYQTDGHTFWDAGNNYDQGRIDSAAAIRALIGGAKPVKIEDAGVDHYPPREDEWDDCAP